MQGIFRGEVEDLGVFADREESRGFWKGVKYKVRSWDNLSSFPCNMVRQYLVLFYKQFLEPSVC